MYFALKSPVYEALTQGCSRWKLRDIPRNPQLPGKRELGQIPEQELHCVLPLASGTRIQQGMHSPPFLPTSDKASQACPGV